MAGIKGDKLKLTEAGAGALRAWLQRNGVTLAGLAEAMGGGAHAMTASRALKRQAWLTLEQAGNVVAFAGGELTAAQLVGMDAAAAVPVLPLRKRRPMPPSAPPAPLQDGAAAELGLDPELAELDETAAGADLPATKRALVELRDDRQVFAGTRVAAASKLAVIALQEERLKMMRGQRAAVDRASLREKVQALIFHATRQWAEATGNSYLASTGQVLTAVPGTEESPKPADGEGEHG
jgi:hypothetical protein